MSKQVKMCQYCNFRGVKIPATYMAQAWVIANGMIPVCDSCAENARGFGLKVEEIKEIQK